MINFQKRARSVWVFLLVFFIQFGIGYGGYLLGKNVDPAQDLSRSDMRYYWKAWDILNQNFYGSIDDNKRIEGSISGMVAGLEDPYTAYLPPTENELFLSDLGGEFSGIGAELTMKNGYVTVVAPLEGTPAEKAGILPNDIVIEVDGIKTVDLNFNDVVTRIRGKSGTVVKLMIMRSGHDKPLDIEVERGLITIKSVKYESLGDSQEVGYLKINQFGADTVDLVAGFLDQIKNSGKKGLLIDLRNNPGGYLDSAVKLTGMLIPNSIKSDQENLQKRVVVIENNKKGKEVKEISLEKAILPEIPIVVLVNGGSASASEILAGALKDYGRAKIVGEKTFGKGSVQNLIDLGNGGSVKVTVAKWFTPLGTGIDGKGIEPDQLVSLGEGETVSNKDNQVKVAIGLLNNFE